MYYVNAPLVYDHPGQLVHPDDYSKRFKGAIAIVKFNITRFTWAEKNVICADLAHLRVLITPTPSTPVTPRYPRKRVLRHDPEFTITQPKLKKRKLDSHSEEGISALLFRSEVRN